MIARLCNYFNRPPKLFWYLILMALLVYMFSGCKSVEYVEVPKIQKEIEYRDRVQRDTVYVHDSIYVHQKNDTIYVDKYKYVYREHIKTDTAFIYKSDTIVKTYQIEKKLTKWQKAKMNVGGYAIFLFIFLLIGGLLYVAIKIFRK